MRIRAPRILTLCLLLGIAAMLGCAGDDDATRDGGGDGALRDGEADLSGDALGASNIGEHCSGVAGCEPGSPLCLVYDSTTAEGICTRACRPDDPGTPGFNEDDCPLGSACAILGEGSNFCLKTCRPSLSENTCGADSDLACRPESTALLPTSRRAVCWLLACRDGSDCPVVTADECEADATCKDKHGDDASCLLSLSRCAVPGNCTVSGICGPHGKGTEGAEVGDPCDSDMECTDNGFCLTELESDGEVLWRNGYCSIANCAFGAEYCSIVECPFGPDLPEFDCAGAGNATCHFGFAAGLCHRACDLGDSDDCRRGRSTVDRGGDYECYNYASVRTQDGLPLALSPVCETPRGCTALGTGVTCDVLGLDENPTKMLCRDGPTGVPTSEADDPDGVCLDETSSGDFADAGVGADAG